MVATASLVDSILSSLPFTPFTLVQKLYFVTLNSTLARLRFSCSIPRSLLLVPRKVYSCLSYYFCKCEGIYRK